MSIRYNRQYKMLAPGVNDDDVYLQGGGGSGNNSGNAGGGNGGGGNTNYTPIVEEAVSVNYEIAASSNLQNEIGDKIKLKYEIRTEARVIQTGDFLVSDGNTDNQSILSSYLPNATLNIYVEKTLPQNYYITKIYYTNKQIANWYPTDYKRWNILFEKVDYVPDYNSPGPTQIDFIGMQATELLTGGVAVAIIVEKETLYPKPIVSFDSTNNSKQIKDSDTDGIVNIKFKQTDSDFVDFYIASDKKIRVDAAKGDIELSFKKDFNGIFGNKKIIVVPYSNLYGTGDKSEIILNFISVNDFPSITEITYVDNIDVPSFSDLEIEYEVKYTTFSTSYVDVDLLLKDKTKVSLYKKLTPNGLFKINLKQLKDKFLGWNGSDNVTLYLKPSNASGDNILIGNEYEIKTSILYPLLNLDESIIKKSIYDAFIEKLGFLEPEKESKYLTHLVNFGNDEQIIISSWENDNWTLSKKSTDELGNEIVKPEDEVKSVILKLYNPLPANITSNSTFWITKLMSNPLIETIVLNAQDNTKCPPIKGPNFNIDVDFVKGNSTNFESLDSLILSGSTTSSANLISNYLSSSLIDTDDLNIQYKSGSTYLWNNFVHFSSAKERVLNFDYKNKLIELYDGLITSASTFYASSLSSQQELERQTIKKNQIIQSFDGFEKYLRSGSVTGSAVLNTLAAEAELYDLENPNYILNNIPQYIVNNENNENFLLFFTMIGQHFDNIYYHTKSIEKSRGLGYKSKDGISNKLLFDALKSMNWDAKNLAADSKLWEYAFGLDSDGNTKETNPAKQRTYEVWRRIINNLPYLLKHKGTRRGVYALMSCYGIPSSNLSIFEFGGPEVNDTSKSKLVFDNMTTALLMTSTSNIDFEWRNTDKNRKPDTIELFVKPTTSGNYDVVYNLQGNLKINISGSIGSDYGVVSLNYGSGILSTSLLPIFNNKFFGIKASREISGSYHNLELSVRQAEKERTIFEQNVDTTINDTNSNWNNGSTLRVGNGFIGSIDEFRLWSEPLDTDRFYEHVSFPEMINGNHISSSTNDLYFRLDFEYPKNLAVSQSFINVDTNIYFSSSLNRNDYEDGSIEPIYSLNPSASFTASLSGFDSITSYPYNFEPIDRSVVLEIPDMGSTRYSTNKVRFESQTTFNGNDVSGGIDLSVKSRATKKAFDQSPTDSNRVGLFFSPTKELNIDIAKSFGGINLDNYIGDPGDRTKSTYTSLDNLRHYYFQRFDNRDIYAYINLIKLYEKSMFEDIKKMLPARVKATTGLLIEPHILERSKIAQKDPTGEDYQRDVTIHYEDTTTLIADTNQYETIINADLSNNLIAENNQYYGEVYSASLDTIIGESYQYDSLIQSSTIPTSSANSYQQTASIDAGLDLPSITTEIELGIETYGQTQYESIGFGIYAQHGNAIRTYFDKNNRRVKERIRVQLITEQKERTITKFAVTASATGMGDPRGGYVSAIETYNETYLNIQPFSGSTIPTVQNDIIAVKPVDGYLPTHYRNTSDLTRGLENSYYKGSKNTAATTLDGTPPIEIFISNPNTLTVNKAGRNTAEPILEVE